MIIIKQVIDKVLITLMFICPTAKALASNANKVDEKCSGMGI